VQYAVVIEIMRLQWSSLFTPATMLIDNATAKYQRMIATCPDEDRETLMNLCEYEVDFFKGWRETVRGNNPECLMYSELRS